MRLAFCASHYRLIEPRFFHFPLESIEFSKQRSDIAARRKFPEWLKGKKVYSLPWQ